MDWCLLSDQHRHQIRNEVHNKCNVLESSWKHSPHPRCVEKLSSEKSVPGAKKVGDHCCRAFYTLPYPLYHDTPTEPQFLTDGQKIKGTWKEMPHSSKYLFSLFLWKVSLATGLHFKCSWKWQYDQLKINSLWLFLGIYLSPNPWW